MRRCISSEAEALFLVSLLSELKLRPPTRQYSGLLLPTSNPPILRSAFPGKPSLRAGFEVREGAGCGRDWSSSERRRIALLSSGRAGATNNVECKSNHRQRRPPRGA